MRIKHGPSECRFSECPACRRPLWAGRSARCRLIVLGRDCIYPGAQPHPLLIVSERRQIRAGERAAGKGVVPGLTSGFDAVLTVKRIHLEH